MTGKFYAEVSISDGELTITTTDDQQKLMHAMFKRTNDSEFGNIEMSSCITRDGKTVLVFEFRKVVY